METRTNHRAGFWLAAFILLLFAIPAFATTRLVPQQYGTIQKAIDSASVGDTVLVAGGNYSPTTNGEIFPINMKSGITLVGNEGPEFTWVQSNSGARVFSCVDVDSTSTITGFRITKGGGIYCHRSSVVITGNVITGNSATYGGGIYCDSSSARIVANAITNNTATYGGGVFNRYGEIRLRNNQVSNNYAYGGHSANGYAGGIYLDSCLVDIAENTIDSNVLFYSGWYPTAYGAGMYLYSCSGNVTDNVIRGNYIYGNWNYLIYSNGYGAGICWFNSVGVLINGNTITDNFLRVPDKSSIYGAGIFIAHCFRPTITRNLVARNWLSRSGGWAGAGVFVWDCISANLDHLTLAENSSGGIYFQNSSGAITNSIVSGTDGFAATIDASSTIAIGYSNFWGNSVGNISGTLPGAGDTTWGRNANGTRCDKYYNIFVDPLFSADTTYHLTEFSPCLDAGDPSSPNDPDGTIADQGVYSYTHTPNRLTVASTPSNAEVYIDTVLFGKTPFSMSNVAPGSYAITLLLAGYQPWIDTVEVVAATTTTVTATLSPATDVGDENQNTLPTEFTVSQNYPNPFNPTTTIAYALPRATDVEITIYNLLGQCVATLVDARQPAGYYHIVWDGRTGEGNTASSGIYLYTVRAGEQVQNKKMVLLK